MAALLIPALIASISLFPLLVVYILRFLLRTAGDHLRTRTSARRELILQRVNLDEQQLQQQHEVSSTRDAPQRTEDEDWERVESYAASTAEKRATSQEKDYAGVIGFFHPFW